MGVNRWCVVGAGQGLVLALVLLVTGCATRPETLPDSSLVQSPASVLSRKLQRENALNSAWLGRNYDELIKTFGAPALVMTVPGFRPVRTMGVVYRVLDKESNCIDAFTMVRDEHTGQWSVANYFCR